VPAAFGVVTEPDCSVPPLSEIPAKFFPEAIPGEVFREEIQSDNAKND
jgi:hypothetical protein